MTTFLTVLAFGTILAVCAFGVLSSVRTEQRRKADEAKKSTLAKDAPDERPS